MKLIKSFLAAIVAVALSATIFTSCTDYQDEIDSLDTRVTALEKLTTDMNTNLSSLSSIVSAMNAGDYITNVTTTEDGYIITFAKAGAITIKNGKDGADASTPDIVPVKDSDGNYYWQLNGEWMLDGDGNKVRANGLDGADAVSPQVRINPSTNEWEVSSDGGTTWTSTGVNATGNDGADAVSVIKSVTEDANYVTITLSDDSTIQIPKTATPTGDKIKLWYKNSKYYGTLLEGHTGYIVGEEIGLTGNLEYQINPNWQKMSINTSGNYAIITNNKEYEDAKVLEFEVYSPGSGTVWVEIDEPKYGMRFNDAITMGNQVTVIAYTAWPEAIFVQPLYSTKGDIGGNYLSTPDIDTYCEVLPDEDYTDFKITSVQCRLTSEEYISQEEADAALTRMAYLEKHNGYWLIKLNNLSTELTLAQRADIQIVYYSIDYKDLRGKNHHYQLWATYLY